MSCSNRTAPGKTRIRRPKGFHARIRLPGFVILVISQFCFFTIEISDKCNKRPHASKKTTRAYPRGPQLGQLRYAGIDRRCISCTAHLAVRVLALKQGKHSRLLCRSKEPSKCSAPSWDFSLKCCSENNLLYNICAQDSNALCAYIKKYGVNDGT